MSLYSRAGKRALDMFIALTAALILSPIIILVSLLIKFTDPGPVIFKQVRVGRGERNFVFYKFRSMPVDTKDIPSDEAGSIKLSRIGKIIRRTNLDELPQLFNIFIGDMSIVGPRPPIPAQTDLIQLRVENGAIDCRPGLTGLAQVNSFDGMSIEKKAALDGEYSKKITLYKDVKIILSTFVYLVKPPPTY